LVRSLERRQSLRRGVGMEVLLTQITQTAGESAATWISRYSLFPTGGATLGRQHTGAARPRAANGLKCAATLRETEPIAIINNVPHTFRDSSVAGPRQERPKRRVLAGRQQRFWERGQVAQVVERSPEKAGVGGSTPSLATIILRTCKNPLVPL
jgi:hypothetical protein